MLRIVKSILNLPLQVQRQESARQQLKSPAMGAQQALRKAHREWAEAQSVILQDKLEKGDQSAIWTLSKTLKKARDSPKMPLQTFKDLQGNLISTPEARAEAWRDVFANGFSYPVKTLTRPELQALLKQRIDEAQKAKALMHASRFTEQDMCADGVIAAAHPSACLVSHRAAEGGSQQQSESEQMRQVLLLSHTTSGISQQANCDERKGGPYRQNALPATLEEWIDAVATAIAKARNGKAPGRDQVTNEIMKAAGPPFVLALAMCLQRIATQGPPLEWRGGTMWPGRRKQIIPLSPANARDYYVPQK